MNSFIDVAEDTQLLQLLKYTAAICKHDAEQGEGDDGSAWANKEIEKVKSGKAVEVYTGLINTTQTYLEQKDQVGFEAVEGVFNSLVYCVRGLPEEQRVSLYKQLSSTLISKSGLESFRLRILSNLFNNLPPSSPSRYFVFMDIFTLASSGGQLRIVADQLANVDKWIEEWGCDLQQKRQLYKHISEGLKRNRQFKQCTAFMTKTVALHNGASKNELDQAKDEAKSLIAAALATPDIYDVSHLLNLDAVNNLKGDKVFELLDVYVKSDLAVFQSFIKANSSLLASIDLTHEDIERKIRLVALTALCAKTPNPDFAAVASALQISRDDVEPWVIDVVRAGLVEAKLDEVNEKIIVSRSTRTEFTLEQWKEVQSRIALWNSNLSDVHNVLNDVQNQIQRQQGQTR